MKCFHHKAKDGLGICRNCFKSVCEDCFQEIEDVMCCKSENCQKHTLEMLALEERSKRICGIGKENTGKISVLQIMFIFVGLIMVGYGVYNLFLGAHYLRFLNVVFISLGALCMTMGLKRLFGKDKINV